MNAFALIMSCALLAGCLALNGCMTVTSGPLPDRADQARGAGPDRRIVGHYFGYTRIVTRTPPTEDIAVEDVTSVGGWLDANAVARGLSSLGVGFHRKQQVVTGRGRCGLTVLVTSDAQLAAVETIIRGYAEGQACVTKVEKAG